MGRSRNDTVKFKFQTEADTSGVNDIIDGLEDVGSATSDLGNETQKVGDQADKTQSAFSRFATVAGGALTAILASGAITLITSQLAAGVQEVFAWDDAMRDFQVQTGATNEELSAYRDIAEDVFTGGFGESVQDVVSSMAEVERITGLTGDRLEEATENALVFRDVFGADINESIDAVDKATIQFGEDSALIWDGVALLMQQTGDPAGDLLETIAEFSPVFADMGYDADAMFDILQDGSDAGIFQFAKIGDAAKEFNIRVKEGGEEVQSVFDDIFASGEEWTFMQYTADGAVKNVIDSTSELFAGISDGSVDVGLLADRVSDYLLGIEDPIERNRMAVALLGSFYEDLGDDVLTAFQLSDDEAGEAAGTMENLKNQMQQGLGPAWTRLKRTMLTVLSEALTPIVVTLATLLVPILEDLAVWLQGDGREAFIEFADFIGVAIDRASEFADGIIDLLGGQEAVFSTLQSIGGTIVDVFSALAEVFGNLSPESLAAIGIALGVIAAPVVIGGIAAAAVALAGMAASAAATALAFAPLLIALALVAAYETNFGGLKDAVNEFKTAVQEGDTVGAIEAIGKALIAIPMGIAEEISKLLGLDFDAGIQSWSDNFEMFKIIVEESTSRLSALWVITSALISAIGDRLSTEFQNAIDAVSEFPGYVESKLSDFGTTVSNKIYTPFMNVADSVVGLYQTGSTLANTLTSLPNALLQWVLNLPANVIAGIETPFLNTVNKVVGFFLTGASFVTTLSDLPAAILRYITNLPGNLIAGIETPFDTSLKNAEDRVTSFVDSFLNFGANIAANVGDLLGSLDNAIVQPFRDIIDRISNLDWSIEFPDWLPINEISGWIADQFAEGGPVNVSGLYKVGERGPELVWLPQDAYVFPNWETQKMTSNLNMGRDVLSLDSGQGGGGMIVQIDQLILQGINDTRALFAAIQREAYNLVPERD